MARVFLLILLLVSCSISQAYSLQEKSSTKEIYKNELPLVIKMLNNLMKKDPMDIENMNIQKMLVPFLKRMKNMSFRALETLMKNTPKQMKHLMDLTYQMCTTRQNFIAFDCDKIGEIIKLLEEKLTNNFNLIKKIMKNLKIYSVDNIKENKKLIEQVTNEIKKFLKTISEKVTNVSEN